MVVCSCLGFKSGLPLILLALKSQPSLYLEQENLYYDITLLNISNYLNGNVRYGNKNAFLANIIYSLFILKPKKTIEEELVKRLEREFPN